ncbi:PP2C family protein-serine/threonine phosphatase [[Erwinia] mediterraneensis]|uniref:PP2C family protein-serine/threonine phosphatase n=1 Tax=[Erwinia] mediterraneensis TaxID=2161819 RepID=UPI001030C78C|nr:protein phosphatase 2C domain-containing protein [[Erwinia] mediterraneensis]
MKIVFSGYCQQGLRAENQDRTGVEVDDNRACFLVCDGVAGLPGGDQAAQLVRDTLLNEVRNSRHFSPHSTWQAIEQCQQALRKAQGRNPNFSRMSTTLAALFIDRERQLSWWAHAGDSRVYHFRHGALLQVTQDHSLAQQLKAAGYENTGINSNLLYNALGAEPQRPVSFSEIAPLEDGDAFLVCTDGFWLNLTTDEMEQALRMVNACEEWLALMQAAINRSEKSDNLSALAIWVGEPQDATLLYTQADTARFLPPHV